MKKNLFPNDNKSKWVKEFISPHEIHLHHYRRILIETRTPFQKVMLADTYAFGRCLVLDGEIQSAQADEYLYHEALVHPALTLHPHPHTILVMGGGEGATARELLKHKSVVRITLVDIDGDVINFCKQHLPSWHQGSFDDPRVRVIIDDAHNFIETTTEKYDVIIADLPSPTNHHPITSLYTREFYQKLIKRLAPHGVFVTQAGSAHLLQMDLHKVLFATLKPLFQYLNAYHVFIPSFDGPWGFLIASSTVDPQQISATKIDARLDKIIRGKLFFYDGITHAGLFNIPQHMRTLLKKKENEY